jgi:hypothetical protein
MINDLDFLQDEMVFIYGLLNEKKQTLRVPVEELAALEMIQISGDLIEILKTEIRDQEQLLARAMQTKSGDEQRYRNRHAKAADGINRVRVKTRAFKSKVFTFSRKK